MYLHLCSALQRQDCLCSWVVEESKRCRQYRKCILEWITAFVVLMQTQTQIMLHSASGMGAKKNGYVTSQATYHPPNSKSYILVSFRMHTVMPSITQRLNQALQVQSSSSSSISEFSEEFICNKQGQSMFDQRSR